MPISAKKHRTMLGSAHPARRNQTSPTPVDASPSAGKALTLEDFIIIDDMYEFPLEKNVPAGYYLAEIARLEPRLKDGTPILDVCYDLYANDGGEYHIRQSYPEGSKPMRTFHQALIAAGIKPGPNMKKAVGLEEKVHLAYWSSTSDIGSIVERVPYHPTNTATVTNLDDDDDDLLHDDDE